MNPALAQLFKSNPALAMAILGGGGFGAMNAQNMSAMGGIGDNLAKAVGSMGPDKSKIEAMNAAAAAQPQDAPVDAMGAAVAPPVMHQAPPPGINIPASYDAMGNVTQPAAGLLTPPTNIEPGQHSARAEEGPGYMRPPMMDAIPRNEDGPGYGRPANPNAMRQKPMGNAAPQPANVPLPPRRPDDLKPQGPWGANPFKAAWADGVQGGSWGAPDDRFVGAFANAAMPPQRGLLWPFGGGSN